MELTMFDFVDEVAAEIESGAIPMDRKIELGSKGLIFCETFFDQFFASFGHDISGFDSRAKREAVQIIERMRADPQASTDAIGPVIVAYEEFCDVTADIQGGYGGDTTTYTEFSAFLLRLLDRAFAWAGATGQDAVQQRIASARSHYRAAAG